MFEKRFGGRETGAPPSPERREDRRIGELRKNILQSLERAEKAKAVTLENVRRLDETVPHDDVMVDTKTISYNVSRNALLHDAMEIERLESKLHRNRLNVELYAMTQSESREAQKEQALRVLEADHNVALNAFESTAAEREKRRSEAFQVHVTCMDERDTFASEATGEPLGAMELFASPGGRIAPETFVRLYGQGIAEAKKAGKEITVHLMPHTCSGDAHAGRAAFKTDEKAQIDYFTKLADELRGRPELEGAKILTSFYETDTHELVPFGGSVVPPAAAEAADVLREEHGVSGKGGEGESDRQHAGSRVYVGDLPRAWTARRNAAYHLHPGMEREELFEGIAFAIKVMKAHSHADLAKMPIVIQLDAHPGEQGIGMTDAGLLKRLNASPLLKGIEVKANDVLVVRTETDPETWEGNIVTESEPSKMAA